MISWGPGLGGAGSFQGAIAEAAKRGLVDLSLVGVDSTTAD
ncbi:hypothetical protein [Streptomyces venezuelae]